ncbi:ribonuclease III family protein, partial [Rivularia sp. UHCC 0363]|uniref:ribonuclease III family protein n=1 Tax=Rivularia sp. UHCC 0363 TaxID=3110244 RepID=UPI002B203C04
MLELPEFQNPALRLQALTHSSYANEHPGSTHNEQLEFIGDAILKIVLSVTLYQNHPELREGALTIRRSELESNETLAEVATRLNLGSQLHLDNGTKKQGGRENDKILSGALEAIIGAYFLEAGLEPTWQYI